MSGRRGWLIFGLIVFGLLSAGSPHEQQQEVARAIRSGEFRLTPQSAVQALRAYLNNEGDLQRYYAYCSAALGRSYSTYYVRTTAEWQSSFAALDRREADVFPVVQPERPLVPYRDFLVEYPPGLFLVAMPLTLLSADFERFQLLFVTSMGLLLAASLLACRALARELFGIQGVGGWLAGWGGICALLLGTIVTHRYDPVVAALLTGACWAGVRRRPAVFGLLLGLAVATKLTPLLCAPPWVLFWLRRRRLGELAIAAATGAATAAAAILPAIFAAGPALFETLRYHRDRPLQSESTAGALFALLGGRSVTAVFTFGSFNFVGPHLQAVLTATTVAMVGGLALVCALTWRRLAPEPADPGADGRLLLRATMATLVVFMVAGKVFSPQYLIWLLPLGLLLSVRDRLALGLFAALSLATQLIYPVFLYDLIDMKPFALVLVLVRNALLAAWAVRIFPGPSSGPAASGSPARPS